MQIIFTIATGGAIKTRSYNISAAQLSFWISLVLLADQDFKLNKIQ